MLIFAVTAPVAVFAINEPSRLVGANYALPRRSKLRSAQNP